MHLIVSSLRNNESLYIFLRFCRVVFPIGVKKNMNKGKAERDSNRQFNELQKNEFLFIASHSGNQCVFESTLSDNT